MRIAPLALGLAVALAWAPAQAATLYSLNSTVLDGGSGENTFVSNTTDNTALAYNSGVPSLTQTLSDASGETSFSVINFTETTLTNIGDSISVTYAFNPSSSSAFRTAQDATMRVGLFNYSGTALSSNITGSSDSAFSGETGYLAAYRPASGTNGSSNNFYQRNATGGTQTALWDSSTRTQLASATPLTSPGTGAVTGTFTLTLVSTGVEITSIINGAAAQSFIDTASPFTTFDSFSFFAISGAVNPTLTFSDLTITYTAVPEPATVLMLGLAGAGLVAMRFRRRLQKA